jgi:hypothetical protein
MVSFPRFRKEFRKKEKYVFDEIQAELFTKFSQVVIYELENSKKLREIRFERDFSPKDQNYDKEKFIRSIKSEINHLGERIYNELLIKRYAKSHKIHQNMAKFEAIQPLFNDLFEKIALDLIEKLKPEPDVNMGSSWNQISFNPKYPRKRLGIFKITYKEYYSLFLDPANAVVLDKNMGLPTRNQILFFLKGIVKPLAEKLQVLNRDKEGGISFKFRESIRGLLTHPDSIVIHYSKKSLRQEIRRIVREVDNNEHTFLLGRNLKSKSGFDFESEKENPYSASHSKIIARRMAFEILLHPPRNWKRRDEIVKKLTQLLDKYKTMNENEILALIELEDKEIRKRVIKEDVYHRL